MGLSNRGGVINMMYINECSFPMAEITEMIHLAKEKGE